MANWANYDNSGDPNDPNWASQNLVDIEQDGQKWQVNKRAAAAFQGLLGDLKARGYNPTSSGGWKVRNKANGEGPSQHSWANAIDINAGSNPQRLDGVLQTDMPDDIAEIAAKHNIEWGGTWKNKPDPMHFEWKGDGPSAKPSRARTPYDDTFSALEGQYGLPTGLMYQAGMIESSLNPNATPNGTYKGMFQYGSDAATEDGVNPLDWQSSARGFAARAARNRDALKTALGRDVTAGEIYLAHQQGQAGAKALLANPNASAIDALAPLYPNRMKAEQAILKNGGRLDMTAAQFAQRWTGKFDTSAAAAGPYNPWAGRVDEPSQARTPDYYPLKAPTWGDIGEASIREMSQWGLYQYGNRDHTPDFNWVSNPKRLDDDEQFKALPETERNWVLENAVSAKDAESVIAQAKQEVADADTWQRAGWWGTIPRLTANVVDPVNLVGMALTGGTSAGQTLGVKLLSSALMGASGAALQAGVNLQTKATYTQSDFLTDTAMGMVMGVGLHAVGHGLGRVFKGGDRVASDVLDDEIVRATQQNLGRAIDNSARERGTFLNKQGEEHFGLAKPATADLSAASNDAGTMGGTLDKVRIDPHNDLVNNGVDEWKSLGDALIADPVGDGGRTLRSEPGAIDWSMRKAESVLAQTERPVNDAFGSWLEEMQAGGMKVPLFKRTALRDKFEEMAARQVYLPDSMASPAVQKAADAYRSAYRRILADAKASGAEWAQKVPEDDTYFPMMMEKEAIRTKNAQIGKHGVISVIKQAMADGDPQAGLWFSERHASRLARSAGNKAAKEEGKAARPVVNEQTRRKVDGIKAEAKNDLTSNRAAAADMRSQLHAESEAGWKADVKAHRENAERLRASARDLPEGPSKKALIDEAEEVDKLASRLRDASRHADGKALRLIKTLQKMRKDETTALRDAAADAARKAGAEQVEKAMREAYANAFKDAFNANAAKFRDAWLQRVARKYHETITTLVEGQQAGVSRGLSGMDASELRDALTARGVPDWEAEEIARTVRADATESGPGSFRRRTPLNAERSYAPEGMDLNNAFSVRDLTNQNAREVLERYAHQTYAHAAVARLGYQSKSALERHIDEVSNVPNMMEKHPHLNETKIKRAGEVLTHYKNVLYRTPVSDPTTVWARATKVLGNFNFFQYMWNSGIAQLDEVPKIMLRTGMRAAWAHMGVGDFISVFRRGEKGVDGLARELEVMGGIATKTLHGKPQPLFDGIEQYYAKSGFDSWLDKAVRVSSRGSQITAKYSGMTPITDVMHRWASQSVLQSLVDHARGVKKLPEWKLNDMGISHALRKDLKAIADNMVLTDRGVVQSLNLPVNSKAFGESLEDLMGAVSAETRRIILEPSAAHLPLFFSKPMGRLLMQFKTYSVASYATNTVRNVKIGPAFAATSLAVTGAWASLMWAGRTYMSSVGRSDQKEFLEKNLTLAGALSAGFKRNSDVGFLPDIYNTLAVTVSPAFGTDLRWGEGTRVSGLGTDLISGNPTLSTINRLQDLVLGSLTDATRSDQYLTQPEAKQRLGLILPFMKAYGALAALNVATSGLPRKEPRDDTFAVFQKH